MSFGDSDEEFEYRSEVMTGNVARRDPRRGSACPWSVVATGKGDICGGIVSRSMADRRIRSRLEFRGRRRSSEGRGGHIPEALRYGGRISI